MSQTTGRLQEIAEALNLSMGTVSRALSGRGEIAAETRERVAQVAADLNYLPKRRAGKRANALARVGVCVGNLCISADGLFDPSFVGLHYMVELERTASVSQAGLLVGFVDAMDSNTNFDQIPVLQRDEAQGLILIYPFPEPIVRKLAARTAVVSIEHVYPSASIDAVGPAHSVDAMSAVEHLYNLGHRRIAYVCDESARGHKLTTGLRHAGYVSGLTRCDLPYRPEDVVNFLPPMVDKQHLAAWVKQRVADGVTAVITSIDRHGYLLWKELPQLGVEVPRDVSLVGIGGIIRAPGQPSLTTWRCNYEMIAGAAFEALKTRCGGGRGTDLYQEIKGIFVAGESSGPPRGS